MKVDYKIAKVNAMNSLLLDFPKPFYYFSHTGNWRGYKVEEQDDKINVELQLPGVDKKDIILTFDPEENVFEIEHDGQARIITLSRKIDEDKIEADLSLGVLKITAPISSVKRQVEIK